jgi:AhpD family alkylhydroperoxidase
MGSDYQAVDSERSAFRPSPAFAGRKASAKRRHIVRDGGRASRFLRASGSYVGVPAPRIGAREELMATKKNGARAQVRREIEEAFGFMPDFYTALPASAIEHAWGLQHTLELSETALDHKTKELIGLAIASHIKCRYCIYFHDKAARAFGATEEELREASAIGGMTTLFSNSITGAQVDYDRFRKDTDRALAYVTSHRPHKPTRTSKPSSRARA